MGVLGDVRSVMENIIEKLYSLGQLYGELKKINNPNRQELINSVVLSGEQKKEIEMYWKEHYGKKIPLEWHRLFQSYTGNFCVDYFPEYLFSSKLEVVMDKNPYNDVLEDKNLLHIYSCEGVHIPKIFFSRCNGLFRTQDYSIVSKEEFIRKISNIGEVVIKPTVETGSGIGVKFVDFQNGMDGVTGRTIEEVIEEYGDKDFAVQECIINPECIRKIYPYGVNTFRVMTYILRGEIFACPILLRIGRAGKRVDNAHAGGMFIGCTNEGILREEAFTEQGARFKEHPDTHLVFNGYQIKKVPEIIETCKKMHAITPQLGLISWDVTLDENENITLLEINTRGGSCWLPQMANGESLLGENTPAILKMLRNK